MDNGPGAMVGAPIDKKKQKKTKHVSLCPQGEVNKVVKTDINGV